MDVQELTNEYQTKSDDELLRLALDAQQLTSEAQFALSGELTRRRLNTSEALENARQNEDERIAEIERDPGKEFFIPWGGIGRMRFGKANKTLDASTGCQQFRSTVFVVLLWFPLVPIGTYLMERKTFTDDAYGVQKLPLDWEQVLSVWAVAMGSVLAAIWLIKLITSDTAWDWYQRIAAHW